MPTRQQPREAVRMPLELWNFISSEGWPRRSQFLAYCEKHAVEGDLYRGYTAMRARNGMPPAMGEAVIAFLRAERLVPDGFTPLESSVAREKDGKGWAGWPGVLATILAPLKESKAAHIDDPDREIRILAKTVVAYVGRMNAIPGSGLSDSQRGEQVMNCTLEKYTKLLFTMYGVNPRSLRYAVTSRNERVSACIAITTTQEACAQICAGTLADSELKADDMVGHGQFHMLNAIVPLERTTHVKQSVRERAEILAVFAQAAYFNRELKPFHPFVFAFAGNRLLEDRLRRHGYLPTGHNLKGTEKAVMVLGHHKDETAGVKLRKQRVVYGLLKLAFRAFQLVNKKVWEREAVALGK